MKLHPRVTRPAVELVKRFEGLRPQAERLAQGGWIIGYGHTLSAREGASVSEADAEALLRFDLSRIAARVDAALSAPVSPPQFEALTAFAFSIGPDAFLESSVLQQVNAGAYLQAAALIERWRRADFEGEPLIVDALVRRRAAEKAHFLTPPEGWAGAPSAVVRPVAEPDEGALRSDAPDRVAIAEVRNTGAGLRSAIADPPGRLGELAPSAVVAAADALRLRLERILAEPEPEASPGPEPAASPEHRTEAARDEERAREQVIELGPDAPSPVPAPQSEAEPELSAFVSEPLPASDFKPGDVSQRPDVFAAIPVLEPTMAPEPSQLPAEPVHEEAPTPAAPDARGMAESPVSEAPPAAACVSPADDVVPQHPAVLAAAAAPRTDWLREEAGGRRTPVWRRWLRDPAMLVFLFAAGAVMFLAALLGMVTGRPAYGGLVLGVVGVALMAPAAGALLFRRLDRARD